MDIQYIKANEKDIAVVSHDGPVLADAQSALDLAMEVKYAVGRARIVPDKNLASKDSFFVPEKEEAIQKLAEAYRQQGLMAAAMPPQQKRRLAGQSTPRKASFYFRFASRRKARAP